MIQIYHWWNSDWNTQGNWITFWDKLAFFFLMRRIVPTDYFTIILAISQINKRTPSLWLINNEPEKILKILWKRRQCSYDSCNRKNLQVQLKSLLSSMAKLFLVWKQDDYKIVVFLSFKENFIKLKNERNRALTIYFGPNHYMDFGILYFSAHVRLIS